MLISILDLEYNGKLKAYKYYIVNCMPIQNLIYICASTYHICTPSIVLLLEDVRLE